MQLDPILDEFTFPKQAVEPGLKGADVIIEAQS